MPATLAPTRIATVCQRFTVAGMHCRRCETAITAELSTLDGVTHVTVDVAAGTVITESVEPLPLDAVAAAIDDAGYRVTDHRVA